MSVEKLKSELTLHANEELEGLKSMLGRIAFEHQKKFSELHDARLTIIKNLHEYLVHMLNWHMALVHDIRLEDNDPYGNIYNLAYQATQYLNSNEIYLESDLAKRIRDLIQEVVRQADEYKNDTAQPSETDRVRHDLDAMKTSLQNRFRELIGVT